MNEVPVYTLDLEKMSVEGLVQLRAAIDKEELVRRIENDYKKGLENINQKFTRIETSGGVVRAWIKITDTDSSSFIAPLSNVRLRAVLDFLMKG